MLAIGGGAIVGALAPTYATGMLGAIGLGADVNLAQYLGSELLHGRTPTVAGAAWAIVSGFAGGVVGGTNSAIAGLTKVDATEALARITSNPQMFVPFYEKVASNDMLKAAAKMVFSVDGLRTLLSVGISNLPGVVAGQLKAWYKKLTGTDYASDSSYGESGSEDSDVTSDTGSDTTLYGSHGIRATAD